MDHLAQCSCGELSILAKGEPLRISVCHCLECQKRTGSPFGVQARFPIKKTLISGEYKDYMRVGGSGKQLTFSFCKECGSTVFYKLEGIEDAISIPVGGFANPDFMAPYISVYEQSKHHWVELPENLEHNV
jgi:hypothetical protein